MAETEARTSHSESKLQLCNIETKTAQLLVSASDSIATSINFLESTRFQALFLSFSFFLCPPRSPPQLFFLRHEKQATSWGEPEAHCGAGAAIVGPMKGAFKSLFLSFFLFSLIELFCVRFSTGASPPPSEPSTNPHRHHPHPNPETISGDETPFLPFFVVRSR